MSRRFRICMAKGGRESARPSYGRSKLTLISRERNHLLGGVMKSWAATILTLEPNPPERMFEMYIKKFTREDFAPTHSALDEGQFRPIFFCQNYYPAMLILKNQMFLCDTESIKIT